MIEKDFWSCEFINDGLYFYTFYEFIEDAPIFKNIYTKLTYKQKYLFRWYVYAHTNLSINAKNLIWDYLNGDCEYEIFMIKAFQIKK